MPLADPSFGWTSALAAFAVIALAAFGVTWLVTDKLHVGRSAYIAVLAVVVATLTAGYLAWSGTSFRDLVLEGWGLALVVGIVTGAVMIPLVRRLPSKSHAHGVALGEQIVWEALVYGIAEALLLATLPVLAAWQAAADLGWTDGGWAKVGAGALAVTASLFVILVHHLGYVEFRQRGAGRLLLGALVSCGLQAVAFLATGNVLAPVVAHVVLHTELAFRGVEMPPVSEEEMERVLRAA